MKFFKKAFLILIFLFPISNSFGNVITEIDATSQFDDGDSSAISGVSFNDDGTILFTLFQGHDTEDFRFVNAYSLSTPYDVSTSTYLGDSKRCYLNAGQEDGGSNIDRVFDLKFSSDGLKLFAVYGSGGGVAGEDKDGVIKFDLTSAYDISSCVFSQKTTNLDSDALQNESKAGNRSNTQSNRSQGLDFNNDGTKLFISYKGVGGSNTGRILEYNLSSPYDLSSSSISLNTSVGIKIGSGSNNYMGMTIGLKGKRIFLADHNGFSVTQITLGASFDTSSFAIDGVVNLNSLSSSSATQPRSISFSSDGLKMFVTQDSHNRGTENVFEYDLACPFNIIAGKCPSITQNSDRTGVAEAQIELAKRTINFSTNSALNRLKWIRRNKDKQNLSNQNIKLNFSNSLLSSLKAVPISSIKKISATKNNNDSNKNYFYWSEGSISLGRVGDTSIASTKEINTNALTFGLDKFTDDYGLEGFAFRLGSDDVDVGSAGSNLDSNTYNITYYSTSPIKDDTKYLDKIFGIGKIRSNITTNLDGKNLSADRTGNQIYGTFKIKDEYKKDKLTFIPSGQFDFGHTILHGYKEAGTGAIEVEDQHVRTKNLRAAMALVEDLSNEKYTLKRHGKLEYVAELDRSSNFKYTYVGDGSVNFNDTLHTGSLHNLNGEIGIDIILPENYSVFIIYERNHAIGTGYTDNLYIALGYLPHEDTEYAFSLNGSENLMSKFEIKKNINGYDLTFNLNDDLTNLGNSKEASINLNKVF